MNRDTLIIPDIHHATDVVDEILARHPHIEHRVFLGDVYDNFGDSPEIARRSATWHRNALADDRNIFILGNHDATYMSGGFLWCSGYSPAKQLAINDVMTPWDWARCRLSAEVNGWLLTHAGYHPVLYWANPETRVDYEEAALRALQSRCHHPLLEAGRARGGPAGVGGITWLDWEREFEPIPGVRQIVGHTRGDEPRVKGENVCIDCRLAWYGIIRAGGKLELFEVDDETERVYGLGDFGEAHTRRVTGDTP